MKTLPALPNHWSSFSSAMVAAPACLIAYDAERFRSINDRVRTLVDLWFAEEREHARGAAVARFGVRLRH